MNPSPIEQGERDLHDVRTLVIFGNIALYGQERANLSVFAQMAKLGMDVRFVTNAQWGHLHIEPELARLGFSWIRARFGPLLGRNLLGLDSLRALWGVLATSVRVWRECRHWRPTHVYVMDLRYYFYALPALALMRRLPLVYRIGDSPPQAGAAVYWPVWKSLCRRASVVIAVSQFIMRQIRSLPIQPKATDVIYTLPQTRAPGEFTAPAAPPGAVVLVYVGQVREHKGVHVLVEAVRRLIAQDRNVVLWIAGEYSWNNAFAEALIEGIRTDGLDERIRFLGYVADVPGLLARAHVHVCPSIWQDPLPNVVIEAKAAGLPSIVFPTGGLPEIVQHGVDGHVCEEPTVDALYAALDLFVSDAGRREAASAGARRNFERAFGVQRFRVQWSNVFAPTKADA